MSALALLFLYFLPTAVALIRKRKSTGWIFVINLITAWTFVGWLVALIWAIIGKPNPNPKPRSRTVDRLVRLFALSCVISFFYLLGSASHKPSNTGTTKTTATPTQIADTAAPAGLPTAPLPSPSSSPASASATSTTGSPSPTALQVAASAATESPSKSPMALAAKGQSPPTPPNEILSATPVPTESEPPPNPTAVADGNKGALPLAKKAFDSRKDYVQVLNQYWQANEKRLRKKYGDDGYADYANALEEATKQEFNRLLEAAIGPKPTEKGDYDKDLSNRVYWNVYARVANNLKESLNDPNSFKPGKSPEFMLTMYKKDWAWGATFDYRAKNGFGALMKDSLNIYVARNSLIGVEHGEPSIADQQLQRALEGYYEQKAQQGRRKIKKN